MKIIGITGLISSGKGTLAECIIQDHGFLKMSFADALKDSAAVMFGWSRSLLEGDTEKSRKWREQVDEFWAERLGKPNFTPRLALQLLGTEAGRDVFGKDIWVASLEKKMLDFQHEVMAVTEDGESVVGAVIPDVRFANEIQLIKKLGGIIVRVQRGDLPEHWEKTIQYNMWKDGAEVEVDEQELIHHGEWLAENIHPSESEWIGIDMPDFIIFNNLSLASLKGCAAQLAKR